MKMHCYIAMFANLFVARSFCRFRSTFYPEIRFHYKSMLVCCVCYVFYAVLCFFVACCVLFVFRCVLCTVYCVLCVGRPLWQMEEQWMKMRGNRFNRSRPLPAHRNINDHRVTQIHVSPFPVFEDNHWKGNHFPEEPIFPFIIGSKTGGMLGSYTSSVALISEKKDW